MKATWTSPVQSESELNADALLSRLQHLEWEGGSDFPVPPQGVIEFSKLSRESNVNLRDLSGIVESEPGLTVELLRSVNSSLIGVREKIDSVPKAIALLGISNCASLFLTKALDHALRFFESPLFTHSDARRESIERARFAREVAQRLDLDPVPSFTAATLQDILLPVLTRQYEKEYTDYLRQSCYGGIEEFERETFGWTHAEITARVLVDWGFPQSLILRVLLHHAPPEELFLAEGLIHEAMPNAAAALLTDGLRQSPSGVPRLVDLRRLHPKLKVLEIAAAVDRETGRTGTGFSAGLTLVNRVQCAMMEQVERSRKESIIPGRQFGNYVLEKRLAESSMGAIFKAKHIMLRRPTAIKFLRADMITPESIRLFEREVQLTSNLSHPNTISIFDFGRTSDDLLFYAMEYIEGPTLTDLVRAEGPLPDGRVIQMLLQVLGSLSEAHSHGLVHRDIKPQNIMLSEGVGYGDRITVLDFGLVTESRSCETGTLSMRGTPLYISPEAAQCSHVIDGRSDLYSVAAVACFLLTGQPVFDGTAQKVIMKHVHTVPGPFASRTSNPISPALEALLHHCLAKNPDDRPESANAAIDLLIECVPESQWSQADSIRWWKRRNQTGLGCFDSTADAEEDTVIGPI